MNYRVIDRETDEYKDFAFFEDAEIYFRHERVKSDKNKVDFLKIELDTNGKVEFSTVLMSYTIN